MTLGGTLANLLRYDPIIGPSSLDSIIQYPSRDAEPFGPSDHRHGFASPSQEAVGSCVAALFGLRCPAAIAGFVIAVIVWVAVYGVPASRARPHVLIKRGETIEPSFAHTYSAPAIIGESWGVWIGAAIYDAAPNPVLAAPRHAVKPWLADGLPHEASTALYAAQQKMIGRNNVNIAAGAATPPAVIAGMVLAGVRFHGQATENAAREVFGFWSKDAFDKIGLNHSSTSFTGLRGQSRRV